MNSEEHQNMMATIIAEMNEMDNCPNCTKGKACKKHIILFEKK